MPTRWANDCPSRVAASLFALPTSRLQPCSAWAGIILADQLILYSSLSTPPYSSHLYVQQILYLDPGWRLCIFSRRVASVYSGQSLSTAAVLLLYMFCALYYLPLLYLPWPGAEISLRCSWTAWAFSTACVVLVSSQPYLPSHSLFHIAAALLLTWDCQKVALSVPWLRVLTHCGRQGPSGLSLLIERSSTHVGVTDQ